MLLGRLTCFCSENAISPQKGLEVPNPLGGIKKNVRINPIYYSRAAAHS